MQIAMAFDVGERLCFPPTLNSLQDIGTEDAKYSRLDLCCRVTFQVSHSPSNKTRSSMFTKNLSILKRRLNFKYQTKPRE